MVGAAVAVGTVAVGAYSSNKASKSAEKNAERSAAATRASTDANIAELQAGKQRAEDFLIPWYRREAEAFDDLRSNYLDTPPELRAITDTNQFGGPGTRTASGEYTLDPNMRREIRISDINPSTGERWGFFDATSSDDEYRIKGIVQRAKNVERSMRNSGNFTEDEIAQKYQEALTLGADDPMSVRLYGKYGTGSSLFDAYDAEGNMVTDAGMRPYSDEANLATNIDPSAYIADLASGYQEYVDSPFYQAIFDENLKNIEGSAAASGMLNSGTTLEAIRDLGGAGARDYLATRQRIEDINEQREYARRNIEEQRFANYINTLQGFASPTTATNLANISIGTAGNIANQRTGATAAINQYNQQATAAQNAAIADQARAFGNIAQTVGNAYMYGGQSVPSNVTLNTDPSGYVTSGTIRPSY